MTNRFKNGVVFFLGLAAGFVGTAGAQTTRSAADTSAEGLLRQMFRPGGAVAPVDPISFPADRPEGVAPGAPLDRSALVREGTFLVNRSATLRKAGDQITCEIDPTEVAPGLPASIVLPGRQLAAIERLLVDKDTIRLIVTARVTEFHHGNYLEISRAVELDDAAVPAAEKTAGAAKAGAVRAPGTQPASKDVPANQLLQQMLGNAAPAVRKVITPADAGGKDKKGMPPSVAPSVAPGAEPTAVMREGTYIVDRTGRLTRGSDGQTWEFTFDADGQAMQDAPVVIHPNLKLMAMETAIASSNRDLRFRVTGMVTEYKQRNHVLLDKVVVVPDVSQAF